MLAVEAAPHSWIAVLPGPRWRLTLLHHSSLGPARVQPPLVPAVPVGAVMAAATACMSLVPVHPVFTDVERLPLAGYLAGYPGLTREAYTLDLRRFTRLAPLPGPCCCSRSAAPTSRPSPGNSKPRLPRRPAHDHALRQGTRQPRPPRHLHRRDLHRRSRP